MGPRGRRGHVALLAAATMLACGSDTDPSDDDAIVASFDFDVTPAEVSFDGVSCGTESSEQIITIENKGAASIAYQLSLSDGSAFVLKGAASGVLAAGASIAVPVTFAPTAGGEASSSVTVDVNGVVQQVPLRARAVGAALLADPPVVDFGEVRYDRVFSRELLLRNAGDAPATIERFDGAADAMELSWDGAPSALTIAPGGEAKVVATIGAGGVTGAATKATLTPVLSSAHCGEKPTVSIAGLRVNTDVTIGAADFGPQPCGSGGGVTRDIVITNYALTELTYTATLPAGSAFTLASGAQGTVPAATPAKETTATIAVALQPTGSKLGGIEEDVAVQIAPLAPPDGGARTAKARVDVRGALITVDPTSASFRSDSKGTDRERFRFRNDGNETIRLRYAIESTTSGVWSIDTLLQDVGPSSTRDVQVGFRPERNGPDQYTGTLVVTRESGASACTPLPQPTLQGERR